MAINFENKYFIIILLYEIEPRKIYAIICLNPFRIRDTFEIMFYLVHFPNAVL